MSHWFDDLAMACARDRLTRRETLLRAAAAVLAAGPLAGVARSAGATGPLRHVDSCHDCLAAAVSGFRVNLQDPFKRSFYRGRLALVSYRLNGIADLLEAKFTCAGSDACRPADPCEWCDYVCGACPCGDGTPVCCVFDDVDGVSPCCAC